MTNRTQCPECFTIFMITDEQLIRSKGKVRCGNCRNTFNAELMLVKPEEDVVRPREDISKSPAIERNDNWDKPHATNATQSKPNHTQLSKPDPASQPKKNSDPSAIAKQKPDSTGAEASTDRKYTSNQKISSSTEISNRSDILDSTTESVQTNTVADEPSQARDQKSARLFSEAVQAIDDTPNFNLDAFTGSGIIDEEFGRAKPEAPSVINENTTLNIDNRSPQHEEPLETDEELSTGFEEPATLYEEPSATYEEPSATYEEPSATYEEPSATYEKPSATYEKPSATYEEPSVTYEEPSVTYEEPSVTYEEPPAKDQEPSDESTSIISSQGDQFLADAFSVIDDTPNFNIEDYSDSNLDNTESDRREAEDENTALQSSVDTKEPKADRLLNDALSVINATPSFKAEDYKELNVDDTESDSREAEDENSALKSSVDTKVPHADKLLGDALSVINATPSFKAEDYKELTVDDTESDPREAEDENSALQSSVDTKVPHADKLLGDALSVINATPSFKAEDYKELNVDDTSTTPPQAELFNAEAQHSSQLSEPASNQFGESDMASEKADQTLITEVDQLIEEKLVVDSIAADERDIIDFSNRTKRSALSRWVYGPGLGLVALLLITVLGYQLWLKQSTPMLENPRLVKVLEPVTKPLKQQLEKYQLNLPERRNLNQLELLSARTEAHPTRASTILLRTSIVNRATISQSFPWLELSLTDEDGRLVSRRALSPIDYLHNNRMENRINANELKQVTIELLAFPKQAHGFELRLLNK